MKFQNTFLVNFQKSYLNQVTFLKICKKSILKFHNREVKKNLITGFESQGFRFNNDVLQILKEARPLFCVRFRRGGDFLIEKRDARVQNISMRQDRISL